MITICHVHHAPANAVYVGRKMRDYTPRKGVVVPFELLSRIRYGSDLANPFRRGETPDPIGAYAALLDVRIAKQNPLVCTELLRIATMAEAQDVALACWCAKEPRAPYAEPTMHADGCHADVIAKVVAEMIEAKNESVLR